MIPKTTHSEHKTVYFQNLDILRLLAAFMVMIAHSVEGYSGWFGDPGSFKRLAELSPVLHSGVMKLIGNLAFGVDIFFLISGFLITYLLLVEKDRFKTIALKNFYLRRTLRIWPLYYLIIAIAPLLVKWLDVSSPSYLPNLFLYNNFNTIYTESWAFPFAHFWSICIEEHFYLVWPLLIAIIPIRKLPYLFFSIILVSIGYRFYISQTTFSYLAVFLHTLSRMDVLAIGGIAAWIHFQKPIQFNAPRFYSITAWCLLILIFSMDSAYGFITVFEILFKKYILVLLAAYIMGSYLFNNQNFLAPKKKNILHYLGKVSYGIYIYHNIFLLVVIKKVFIDHDLKSFWLFQFVFIGGTILISILSYELFEKWFLKFKKRFELVKTKR